LYNGWTGSSLDVATAVNVSFAAQQAAAAAANQAQQTAAINAQLPHFYGGTGANGNNYSLPLAAIPATGFTLTNGVYLYGSQLLTDSETVSAIWNQVLAWTSGTSEVRTVFLRSNTGATTYCYAKMSLSGDPGATPYSQTPAGDDGYSYIPNDPSTNFVIEIGCYVAGVKTVFQTWSYPFWTYWITAGGHNLYVHNVGHTYYVNSANHVFAFEATSYAFEVDFAGLSLTVSDGSHVSQQGASYRSGGFSDSSTDVSLQMSWDFYDSGPTTGPGTAYVATLESIANTNTYSDLATTTDQVTVNVGASGMLLVMIYSGFIYSNQTNGLGYMSFTLSGANTQAASDAYSGNYQSYTSGGSVSLSATFLLTGLNQGATTVKAKYRQYTTGYTTYYQDRRVTAIPL
jgi:hypothetical protein